MAKRDTVKQRLEYWLEELVDWREILPADEYRARYRRKIADCRDWKPVDRAAQYFGLDPADPTDLKVLLRLLAHVVFGEPKKRGRKKGSDKWGGERYFTLGARLHELETKAGSRLSDSQAARKLVEDYTEYGREWTTLRQRLPKARLEFALANIDVDAELLAAIKKAEGYGQEGGKEEVLGRTAAATRPHTAELMRALFPRRK
jgi:hypothetical protein